MESITQHEARPARILSWISAGVMLVVIVAACLFGASSFGQGDLGAHSLAIPAMLTFLACLLSYVVLSRSGNSFDRHSECRTCTVNCSPLWS